MKNRANRVLMGLGILSLLLPRETATTDLEEAAADSGLVFQHHNGRTGAHLLPEITGSGVALFDYDRDGDLDVYLVQGAELTRAGGVTENFGLGDQLFRNELVPEGRLRFVDVTISAGIRSHGYGMGVSAADFDGDGWSDLYVTNFGPNQLWMNNGDGTFRDSTTHSGVGDPRWSTSAAPVDFDGDGRLDLFVANYVEFSAETRCYSPSGAPDYCGPQAFQPAADRLYRNLGEGRFEDWTTRGGLGESGAGLGVVSGDFNLDGLSDLYVANDGMANQLWLNQGGARFINDALFAGVALNRRGQAEAGMGIAVGDFDNDGDEDLFVSHLDGETNTLYENDGSGLFEDRSLWSGLATPSIPFTGFGAGWIDIDNDGWLDLLVVNGAVRFDVRLDSRAGEGVPGQRNQLFRQRRPGLFVDISDAAGPGFRRNDVSRGAAFGDIDNDGDTDVVVANNCGPVRLLLSRGSERGSWTGLDVRGASGNPGLGARVEMTAGERTRTLWIRGDGSYCSSGDPRVLVGLGPHRGNVAVRVFWPGGATEEWPEIAPGRYHVLSRGKGRVLP